jgi:RHH-type proline utilization regulon transcriptional repressor/proline dehydrogenase/delta 1-pyrroline-5-carboxylate dehydrogenase
MENMTKTQAQGPGDTHTGDTHAGAKATAAGRDNASRGHAGDRRVLDALDLAEASTDDDAQRAAMVAAAILEAAELERTPQERREEARLRRLVADPEGRHFTVAFADRFLRPRRPSRAVEVVRRLLGAHGVPTYLGAWQRLLLHVLRGAGGLAPGLAHARVRAQLTGEVGRVSWSASKREFERELETAQAARMAVIVNHLGEHVLGHGEADARLARYLETLREGLASAVSVKLSSVAARLDAYPTDAIIPALVTRIGRLVEAALARPADSGEGALVMLDMEEYRDVELTLLVLEGLAERFPQARVGVVVQAYLADSRAVLERVISASEARVAAGGPPLQVRLVKGANLAMERVEASVRGWPLATLPDKASVDRSYRVLMRRAVDVAARGRLVLGIASHNIFDVALGMIWRRRAGAETAVGFEMLAGISRAVGRVVAVATNRLTIYAPVVAPDDTLAAIAYLIRRFDENTSPDNYLRNSFGLRPSDAAFEAERRRVVDSLATEPVPVLQLARGAVVAPPLPPLSGSFVNEPDTDWTAPARRAAMTQALAEADALRDAVVTPRVAGRDVVEGPRVAGVDPSCPGLVRFHTVLAPAEVVEVAIATAATAARGSAWCAPSATRDRADALERAAALFRERRNALIAAMTAETGKIPVEGDVEVSEAVDFMRWYAQSAREIADDPGGRAAGLGVVVVASPWNFPLAIAAGGLAAALVAGNAVIFKPAPEATRIGRLLVELLADAGVPDEALQFLPCANQPEGETLIRDPRVDAVILTGGTATARRFLSWRPTLRLFAETGGKNALIITDTADRDLAIKHAIHGAFGHAGQKCSATSLLICEEAVLEDPHFLARLRDAAAALVTGSAWSSRTDAPPLIRTPRDALAEALGTLLPGESWLLEPRVDPANPRLVSPGIKLGVARGSPTHMNELFGPVLAVMRARDLAEAVAIANEVPYGLTAGLESLDEAEQAYWLAHIEAGNLYLNRPTTGAIVGRQPFGGMKASVFGPGAKAGGPNYVRQLMRPLAATAESSTATPDHAATFAADLAEPRELVGPLVGQDNHFRLRPMRAVLVRLAAGASGWEAERMLTAARTVGTPVLVSAIAPAEWHAGLGVPVTVETPEALTARLDGLSPRPERVRVSGQLAEGLQEACVARGWYVDDSPLSPDARVELLKYLREQSVSRDYHRYGNLGRREVTR